MTTKPLATSRRISPFLQWHSRYGQALVDAHEASSSDHWGDRIVDAADKLRSRDRWEPMDDDDDYYEDEG
jgi:hypothetical protein